jgi:hypothetical protein
MKKSVFIKYFLPFLEWYLLLILTTIGIDYFLHRYQMVFVGRYFGFIGTVLILVSFIYSLRKRKIIEIGSPKKLLLFHEYIAWIGSILILVHAGIHFNAILPWLAVIMLLINVASGLIGKYILKKANESLQEKRIELIRQGLSEIEVQNKLFWDSITYDVLKKWRAFHYPIALLFVLLTLLHIITIIIYT